MFYTLSYTSLLFAK